MSLAGAHTWVNSYFSQYVDDTTPCLLISVIAFEKTVDRTVVITIETIFSFLPSGLYNLLFDFGVWFFSLTMSCFGVVWLLPESEYSFIYSRVWLGLSLWKMASPQFSLVFSYRIPMWHILGLFFQSFISPIFSFLYLCYLLNNFFRFIFQFHIHNNIQCAVYPVVWVTVLSI